MHRADDRLCPMILASVSHCAMTGGTKVAGNDNIRSRIAISASFSEFNSLLRNGGVQGPVKSCQLADADAQ